MTRLHHLVSKSGRPLIGLTQRAVRLFIETDLELTRYRILHPWLVDSNRNCFCQGR